MFICVWYYSTSIILVEQRAWPCRTVISNTWCRLWHTGRRIVYDNFSCHINAPKTLKHNTNRNAKTCRDWEERADFQSEKKNTMREKYATRKTTNTRVHGFILIRGASESVYNDIRGTGVCF